MKNHELLLPVANMSMCLAAIHNGADAIYVGAPRFNARGRTEDLSHEELKEIIDLCHLYGVKVNLALNIVIFDPEIPEVVKLLEQLLPLGADAIIVQDLGVAQIIRQMAPHWPIHASTQMTVTNYEAIQLLEDLNIKRFVLGRENSLKEIEIIRDKTERELEVFVHGALCVAYSGQCFTSESIGGRSANRGQCAQSCRFAYELIVDGKLYGQIEESYLVSPQDLCGIDEIPSLQKMGVDSFKIEGRLKSAEYVAISAKSYRAKMLDSNTSTATLKRKMATTYSRGLYSGWLHGVHHQHLVNGTFSSHRGHYLGKISQISKGRIGIIFEGHAFELVPGDGLMFVSSKGRETGGQIYSIGRGISSQELWVKLADNFTDVSFINGDVYLNRDQRLEKETQQSFTDKNRLKKIALSLHLKIAVGEFPILTVHDGNILLKIQGHNTISRAEGSGTSVELMQAELSALGNTVYVCSSFSVERDCARTPIYFSQKDLKILRRSMVQQINNARVDRQIKIQPFQDHLVPIRKSSNNSTMLNILLRDFYQVETIVNWNYLAIEMREFIDLIILDFEFGKDYKKSVELLRERGFLVAIATTRILKPNEYHNFRLIENAKPDAILIRNLGALYYFTATSELNVRLLGDFSLNVANHLSASYLLGKGLSSVALSYDLNINQINHLLERVDTEKIEITIYQYMPSFHMEHCVFAAFLSSGKDFRDCGRPCEKFRVELKDQFGNFHHIKADQECRNTMYNAVAQSATSFIHSWKKMGVGLFRYEALFDHGDILQIKIGAMVDYIAEKINDETLISKLRSLEKYGLGTGSIDKSKEYQSRKN